MSEKNITQKRLATLEEKKEYLNAVLERYKNDLADLEAFKPVCEEETKKLKKQLAYIKTKENKNVKTVLVPDKLGIAYYENQEFLDKFDDFVLKLKEVTTSENTPGLDLNYKYWWIKRKPAGVKSVEKNFPYAQHPENPLYYFDELEQLIGDYNRIYRGLNAEKHIYNQIGEFASNWHVFKNVNVDNTENDLVIVTDTNVITLEIKAHKTTMQWNTAGAYTEYIGKGKIIKDAVDPYRQTIRHATALGHALNTYVTGLVVFEDNTGTQIKCEYKDALNSLCSINSLVKKIEELEPIKDFDKEKILETLNNIQEENKKYPHYDLNQILDVYTNFGNKIEKHENKQDEKTKKIIDEKKQVEEKLSSLNKELKDKEQTVYKNKWLRDRVQEKVENYETGSIKPENRTMGTLTFLMFVILILFNLNCLIIFFTYPQIFLFQAAGTILLGAVIIKMFSWSAKRNEYINNDIPMYKEFIENFDKITKEFGQ